MANKTFYKSKLTLIEKVQSLDFFLIQEGDNGTCTIDEEGILTYNPSSEFPHTNLENGSDICSFYATDVEFQSNTSNILPDISNSSSWNLFAIVLPY